MRKTPAPGSIDHAGRFTPYAVPGVISDAEEYRSLCRALADLQTLVISETVQARYQHTYLMDTHEGSKHSQTATQAQLNLIEIEAAIIAYQADRLAELAHLEPCS